MTRPPSEAADLTYLIPHLPHGPRPPMRVVSHLSGNVVRHKKTDDLTSATGQSLRLDRTTATSCRPRWTDILRIDGHVSKVPTTKVRQRQ